MDLMPCGSRMSARWRGSPSPPRHHLAARQQLAPALEVRLHRHGCARALPSDGLHPGGVPLGAQAHELLPGGRPGGPRRGTRGWRPRPGRWAPARSCRAGLLLRRQQPLLHLHQGAQVALAPGQRVAGAPPLRHVGQRPAQALHARRFRPGSGRANSSTQSELPSRLRSAPPGGSAPSSARHRLERFLEALPVLRMDELQRHAAQALIEREARQLRPGQVEEASSALADPPGRPLP